MCMPSRSLCLHPSKDVVGTDFLLAMLLVPASAAHLCGPICRATVAVVGLVLLVLTDNAEIGYVNAIRVVAEAGSHLLVCASL